MYELVKNKTVLFWGILSGYFLAHFLYQWRKRNAYSKIKKLVIYPIKSLKGVEVDHLNVIPSGVKWQIFHDRSFVLINEHNNMITQRTKPKLSLIQTSFHGDQIWLEAPNMTTLKIDYNLDISSNEVLQFEVWGKKIQGAHFSDEASSWFSKFLNSEVKLIKFMWHMNYRSACEEYFAPIIYQDGFPFLLINQSSVDDLNNKLNRNDRVSFRNFRPNILIENVSPYEEDDWKELSIGQVGFRNVKLCERCTMTTVIIDKGVKSSNGEPLKTLKTYRIKEELNKDSPTFGVNLISLNEGTIQVGDKLNILE